jgi:hypothetical protein
MNDRNYNRRRRGGQRFRPGKPTSFKPERAASEARAAALGEKDTDDTVFDQRRHEVEVTRAENVAAGLPADAPTAGARRRPPTGVSPAAFRHARAG